MHQRLVEGALAGGFFLVNRLPPERDGEPLRPWFADGEELATFDSAGDLLEKCGHYLAHPQEREALRLRMRERALREQTVERSAGRVLAAVRRRLSALEGRVAS